METKLLHCGQKKSCDNIGVIKVPDYLEDFVTCPLCGYTYSHLKGVLEQTEGKTKQIQIEIDGECGHRWLYVLSEYKGEITQSNVLLVQEI